MRQFEVVKMRGANYVTGRHFFEMSGDGLTFYPRVRGPVVAQEPAADLADRVTTGVTGLDALLLGGLPRASTTVVEGGTGTGKTLVSLQFLLEGARRGEPGIFFTLEGPEGAGKTTQSLLLADYLRGSGWDVVAVREPGGTAIGERIRSLLLDPRWTEMDARAEMLLFAAARAQLVAEVIAPALRAGKCVVCDRFVDASLAYQGIGRRLGVDVVRAVNAVATGAVTPDLTLLLDLDPSTGLRRARAETQGGVAAGNAGRGDRMDSLHCATHSRTRRQPSRRNISRGERI